MKLKNIRGDGAKPDGAGMNAYLAGIRSQG